MEKELSAIYRFFAELPGPATLLFVSPFVLLLLCIAILPLAAPHFWEKNSNKAKVSLIFGIPVAVFFLYRDLNVLALTSMEYCAFIGLLGALYVISGGIYIRGTFKDTPLINTAFFGIGALLANVIGTTGASMLLIRPLIRANRNRHHKVHTIIFFIFIVSNCSGILTPLGDPPLFLGFLKGVDFTWTLRLYKQFLFVNGLLLIIYYLLDLRFFKLEPRNVRNEATSGDHILSERFGIAGKRNFILLASVIAVNIFSGNVLYKQAGPEIFGERFGVFLSQSVQIACFAILAWLSYRITPKRVHEHNHFNFSPIIEVAVLFAGIFAAMIPTLIILETKAAHIGIDRPWQFFWLTGSLSSFLDNAPTYLTFTSLAKGSLSIAGSGLFELSSHPAGQKLLAAISCGAVFMGANTYIGNGPNFMVKAICEHSKIKMPGFFNYMLWSFAILIPVFALVTLIFFSSGL